MKTIIIELLLDKKGEKASNYNGIYLNIYGSTFALNDIKIKDIKKIIKIDNNLQLLYEDGPITNLIDFYNLSNNEIYNLTIKTIDNFIKDTESSIEYQKECIRQREIEEERNSFYEHW